MIALTDVAMDILEKCLNDKSRCFHCLCFHTSDHFILTVELSRLIFRIGDAIGIK